MLNTILSSEFYKFIGVYALLAEYRNNKLLLKYWYLLPNSMQLIYLR